MSIGFKVNLSFPSEAMEYVKLFLSEVIIANEFIRFLAKILQCS